MGRSTEFSADVFGDITCDVGEGPRWDDLSQTVTWVDLKRGLGYRGTVEAEGISITDELTFPDTVAAVLPSSDGGLLVVAHDHLVAVSSDGRRRSFPPILDREQRLRLNDAACDASGRVIVGGMAADRAPGATSLFSVATSGEVSVLREGVTVGNGIGWSPDGTTMYFVDSVPGVLWSVPYDAATGAVGTWCPLVERFETLPDGLCVDDQGRIWLGMWRGSQVQCIAPTGELLGVVRVPVPNVTAAAFVGPRRDRLLITTARDGLDEAGRGDFPLSGRMFIADVGAVGVATHRWAG